MELKHEYNFNDPVEVTEIFRFIPEGAPRQEYGSKTAFGWEDIMYIKQYPYDEDWVKFVGPKYYLKLRGYSETLLVLGDYDSMVQYWTLFRNKYPLFIEPDFGGKEDDNYGRMD